MNQVHIRDMQDQDISYVARIDEICFSTPWSETSLLNELQKPVVIARIATMDNSVVGYIFAEHLLDEGQILKLAVHPDYRKMKIATLLLENIIEELRSRFCRAAYLEVRASESAAQRLYKNCGFKVSGIRKGYYTKPNENALIMLLQI